MSQILSRRNLLVSSAGAAAAFRFAPAIAQASPFKIGLLTVKTGPLSQGGIQMEQGIVTFLKEKANTLGGRKIEFISADTGGNPAGAKTKTQELIERDKVNVIIGPLAAFELLAILDYVRDTKTPLISLAGAEDVTQRRSNPFVIRASAIRPSAAMSWATTQPKTSNIDVPPLSRRTLPSDMSSSLAFNGSLRTTAAKSSRSCGRLS
jgi:branched-chain amino acid transport system substrate-binding protein